MELTQLKGKTVAFGTNITLPLFFQSSAKDFAKSLVKWAWNAVRKETKTDWGKRVSRKATKSLIPCIKEAYKEKILVFDCSRAYGGSEQRLGKALKNVPREDVYIITKISDNSQFLGRVEDCFAESLRYLNTDYVDLLLLHWPVDYPKIGGGSCLDDSVPVYARSWHILEEIYKSGRAKAIGVANFSIAQLERLRQYAEIMPMADEFECHPLCIRKELNEYCIAHDMQVFAYASLCGMDARLRNDDMREIAKAHGKSIAQVILKWHMQQGRIPIFGTSRPERIREYAHLDDFTLTDCELDVIDAQNINYRSYPDSEHCDFIKGVWIGWEKYKDCCP